MSIEYVSAYPTIAPTTYLTLNAYITITLVPVIASSALNRAVVFTGRVG